MHRGVVSRLAMLDMGTYRRLGMKSRSLRSGKRANVSRTGFGWIFFYFFKRSFYISLLSHTSHSNIILAYSIHRQGGSTPVWDFDKMTIYAVDLPCATEFSRHLGTFKNECACNGSTRSLSHQTMAVLVLKHVKTRLKCTEGPLWTLSDETGAWSGVWIPWCQSRSVGWSSPSQQRSLFKKKNAVQCGSMRMLQTEVCSHAICEIWV